MTKIDSKMEKEIKHYIKIYASPTMNINGLTNTLVTLVESKLQEVRQEERKIIAKKIKDIEEPDTWNINENDEQQGLRFGWRECKSDILSLLEDKEK